MIELLLIAVITFAMGFGSGFATRAYISHLRRQRERTSRRQQAR
jgi:hypothetical protein